MAFETAGQGIIFLSFFYLGAGLYAVFMLLGLIGKIFDNNKAATAVLDFVFCVTAGAAVLFVVIYKGRGELRGYMLLGVIIGFVFIKTTIERIAFYANKKLHELKAETKKKKE